MHFYLKFLNKMNNQTNQNKKYHFTIVSYSLASKTGLSSEMVWTAAKEYSSDLTLKKKYRGKINEAKGIFKSLSGQISNHMYYVKSSAGWLARIRICVSRILLCPQRLLEALEQIGQNALCTVWQTQKRRMKQNWIQFNQTKEANISLIWASSRKNSSHRGRLLNKQ